MDSQKTSKSSMLNLTLLRAWRERWTDCQWGINIKTVLPRGVSGDVYNLSSVILSKATVGSTANPLIMSYLKHSLCCQLISHAAVIKTIAQYESYGNHYCIGSLLEFLNSTIAGITCRSKSEENIMAQSMLMLLNWCIDIFSNFITIKNSTNLPNTFGISNFGNFGINEQNALLQKLGNLIDKIVNNQFVIGVLYIAQFEDPELYATVTKKYEEVNMVLQRNPLGIIQVQKIHNSLRRMVYIRIEDLAMREYEPKDVEAVTYCLQPLLAVDVLLNPSVDTHTYVEQLLIIQRIKGYSMPRLYCDIIRACLISLNNVSGTTRESIWCAFTFIKIPHILKQLNHSKRDEKLDYSPDVVAAFELLLEDPPILDYMDTKCACNTVECLLTEMQKQRLINEKHIKHFSAKRDAITTNLQKLDTNNSQPSIVKFVIRAEPPLAGILKTLSTDYNKVQEALLSMLCQVLSGNSFELILSVATVEGKLKTFVSRLIKCNECSKQIAGEVGKAAVTRSALFDVSFLMLSFIVQTYGSDVVLDENGDSFFEKWVRDMGMVERNKSKSPMNMVQLCDQSKVNELISLSNKSDGLKNSNLKWHEICLNIPGILYHVLLAWENETLSATDVKFILDSMKTRLCAFSVCAASWLCAYMQIVRQDELLKPMNMVKQFLTVLSPEEMSQQENFKERLGLTFQIIRKIQHDIMPAGNPKIRALLQTQNLVSHSPLENQFDEIWKTVADRGWLPIEATQTLESLLQSCGPFWLVNNLVNKILVCKYVKEMNKTMDIVFAIMHLDIERCTISLLSELIPMTLLNKLHNTFVEPHSIVIAKLCVYAIISAIEVTNPSKKRSRNEMDSMDMMPSAKMRKLTGDMSGGGGVGELSVADFILDVMGGKDVSTTGNIREPLKQCLRNLFNVFSQFILTDDFSPKMQFIFQFFSLLVQCGKNQRIVPILNLLPNSLVQNLLKTIATDDLSVGFVLRLHDLTSVAGRQIGMSDLCLLRNIQLRRSNITV